MRLAGAGRTDGLVDGSHAAALELCGQRAAVAQANFCARSAEIPRFERRHVQGIVVHEHRAFFHREVSVRRSPKSVKQQDFDVVFEVHAATLDHDFLGTRSGQAHAACLRNRNAS